MKLVRSSSQHVKEKRVSAIIGSRASSKCSKRASCGPPTWTPTTRRPRASCWTATLRKSTSGSATFRSSPDSSNLYLCPVVVASKFETARSMCVCVCHKLMMSSLCACVSVRSRRNFACVSLRSRRNVRVE